MKLQINNRLYSFKSLSLWFKWLFILPLIFFLNGCVVKKKNDLQNLSLYGKVKTMIELQYFAVEKFGKVEKGDLYRDEGWDMVLNFDEHGYYSDITYLNSSGQEVGHTDYLHNSENEIIEKKNYDAEGGFSDRNVFSYDEKKRVSQVIEFNSAEGLNGSTLVEYEDNENRITTSSYNARGKLLQKEICQVDKNGFPLETKIYNGKNELINYRRETFNDKGLRQVLTVLSPDEQVLMQIFFQYDKKENLIRQEGTDENGKDFLPVRYEYVFDKQGNWTKRIEYVNNKPTLLLERQFEYYE